MVLPLVDLVALSAAAHRLRMAAHPHWLEVPTLLPGLTPEQKMAWEVNQFVTFPDVPLRRCQDYLLEARMLLPQAQAKKHGQVLAQDLDSCVGQLTKLLTAVSKIVGKTLEEVNQSAVEQL